MNLPAPKMIAAAGVAIIATLGLPTLAGAHEGHDPGPRAERICSRVPVTQARLQRAMEWIDDDADRRGSLEWLAARKTDAEAEDREHLADWLERRIATRQATRDWLVARTAEVDEVAQLCADHGLGE